MANLKSIRKRIVSVKNTQKITKAMKMVAAARLRKAQQNITELRPYALKTLDVIANVAERAGDEAVHPLLQKREVKRVGIVLITSDRGLAGAFNSNICKAAFKKWKELEAEGKEVSFDVIGRKGRDFFKRRDGNVAKEFTGVFENLNVEKAGEIGSHIIEHFTQGKLDAVYVVYNEFKSAIAQQVNFEQLLPVIPHVTSESTTAHSATADYLYEPSKTLLLDRLLPMYIQTEVFRALSESLASEHGARMTAMDAATKNASEMIGKLTLVYNRARQAAITTELMEIIGGSEALKG